MMELRLAGAAAEVDVEATGAWYAQAPVWDCTCGHCRNFVTLARERKLPAELLELLDKLGIPPEKAAYVCELYDKENRLLYEAAYPIAGSLTQLGEDGSFTTWGGTLQEFRREFYPPGTAQDFPTPNFLLCCNLWLPWVLNEPIEG